MPAFSRLLLAVLAVCSLPFTPRVAHADTAEGWTVDPEYVALTLADGEEVTEALNVHIPAVVYTDALDVYLLTDSTGSMGGAISGVKGSSSALVSLLFDEMDGVGVDLRIGVGNYKDLPDGDAAFTHQLELVDSGSADEVVAAIGAWKAGGGGDGPEATFYAMHHLAEGLDPAGDSIGWRDDASRVLIWIGDAPAHDPVCAAMSGLAEDLTEASVTEALVEAGITVMSVSTSSWYTGGLNGDPTTWSYDYDACGEIGGSAGQATRITGATGGVSTSLGRTSGIASRIRTLIEMPISGIDELVATPDASLAPYVVGVSPAAYTELDTMEPQDLTFDITWLGVCSDDGESVVGAVDLVADGEVMGQQEVSLSLPACSAPPVAVCEDQLVEADGDCLACASVDGGSYDPEGGAVSVTELATCDYELGETTVTLVVTDEDGLSATCEATVTVIDASAPAVSSRAPEMWPPNHKYESFSLSDCATITWDNCDADGLDIDLDGEITSISSDEPEDSRGLGDGATTDDIIITGATTFLLRAEREGAGDGRVYTVRYEVMDSSGNTQAATCAVSVPHDMSGKAAVDDGVDAGYTVTR